jgi:hypothetical protein
MCNRKHNAMSEPGTFGHAEQINRSVIEGVSLPHSDFHAQITGEI